MPSKASSDLELLEANRRFYDTLWSDARLVEPERFNTWPLVRSFIPQSRRRLEVAPGLRPRLPIEGTQFLDISAPALARLRERGAGVVQGAVSSLPFPAGTFDLVCAFDIVEHVDDDDLALHELSRVAAADATVLLSAPLDPSRWTAFDELVGHRRRYKPEELLAKLAEHGLSVERSAVYGMRPRSSWLANLGMWGLTHRRERAMWWYNRVMMPLAVRFQKKLALVPGMVDTERVDEVLLVCRRDGGARFSPSLLVQASDVIQ
ncbi:MAG: class I SAM-dependent methyltransferase [Burkholderiales bacterium]